MSPSDVARSYDSIADRWVALRNLPDGIAAHKRALGFLVRKDLALDVGCGCSGRFANLLLEHGFELDGIDISSRMIELARMTNPGGRFVAADICDWQPQTQYDFISAWDSLWHVPLAKQAQTLAKLTRALAPAGVILFTTPGVEVATEHTDTNMGPEMYYAGLGIPATLQVLSDNEVTCRHLEYDQYPELHVYLIGQRV